MPPSDAVWSAEMAELAVLLASRNFARAPALTRILSYICQEYFQGRAEAIKEYNIAVDALGRSPEFDPADDSIVRVEISRIRKRLQHYYLSEGASHSLRMVLPESGYAIQFVRQEIAPEAEVAEPPKTAMLAPARMFHDRKRRILLAGAIGLLCTTALLVAALLRNHPVTATSGGRTGFPVRTGESAGGGSGPRSEALRIAAGSTQPKYVDRSGQIWVSDRFFTGGDIFANAGPRILRTGDPALYLKARTGNFKYDIPLKPGYYELHLHFAEIGFRESPESSGETFRRFNVSLNGRTLLQDFDIALDTPGTMTADEKVFPDVTPGEDGFLHLQFQGYVNRAMVNGIEVLPSAHHRILPVRILAGQRTVYDDAEHFWASDRYFQGGKVLARRTISADTREPELFSSERFGNFSYYIPVAAEGRYAVTLRFAESNFGVDNWGTKGSAAGPGSRVFDVFCNGTAILRNLDILKEAGLPNRGLAKTVHGLKANAQGKLVLSFMPLVDYATIRSIEVLDESQ
jgi:hypothetical protein